MARILWHGIGPWHKTGYGVQTALFAPRLAQLGHEVVIAHMGRPGIDSDPDKAHPDAKVPLETGQWEGLKVIGPGLTEFGLPVPVIVRSAFGGAEPDLIIVCKDAWILNPSEYARQSCPVAVLANIDCDPMGTHDRVFFERSGTTPVAVSLNGLSLMRKAGLEPLYVPHGIDGARWQPMDRGEARELLGLPAKPYIAGINAANIGPRKGWGEQFAAFAAYRQRMDKDALLLVHSVPEHPEGISLRELAAGLGIADAVVFGSHTNMKPEQMRSWYCAIDQLLACSYGEGFGLPIAEALSCGTPVIGTRCSAISEKILPGAGHLVSAQPWWNPHHQAWWHIPRVKEITAKMGQGQPVPVHLRNRYDADMIVTEHWKPALDILLGG